MKKTTIRFCVFLILVFGASIAMAQSGFALVTPELGKDTTTEWDEGYIALGPPGVKAMLVLHPDQDLYKRIAAHKGEKLVLHFTFEP